MLRFVFAAGIVFSFSIAYSTTAIETPNDVGVYRDAPSLCQPALLSARKVIRAIPRDVRALSEDQVAAIALVGSFRDGDAVADLIPHVLVPAMPKKEVSVFDRIREFSDAGANRRHIKDFEKFPVAVALIAIGWESALGICRDMEARKGQVADDRLGLYADILSEVLGYHAVSFLQEERAHAPEIAGPIYDRLLNMPEIMAQSYEFHRAEGALRNQSALPAHSGGPDAP